MDDLISTAILALIACFFVWFATSGGASEDTYSVAHDVGEAQTWNDDFIRVEPTTPLSDFEYGRGHTGMGAIYKSMDL